MFQELRGAAGHHQQLQAEHEHVVTELRQKEKEINMLAQVGACLPDGRNQSHDDSLTFL